MTIDNSSDVERRAALITATYESGRRTGKLEERVSTSKLLMKRIPDLIKRVSNPNESIQLGNDLIDICTAIAEGNE